MSKPTSRRALILLSVAIVVGVWNNITLSPRQRDSSRISDELIGTTSDQAFIPKTQSSTNSKRKCPPPSATTTQQASGTSTSVPSFPKWNDPNGISWNAIESYIRYADQHLTSGKNLLKCPRGGCPIDMPNVLYIFGAHHQSMSSLLLAIYTGSTSGDESLDRNQPFVWVEGRRRKLVGPGFSAKRYPIVEELMHASLQYLLTNPELAQSQFVRLYRVLFPQGVPTLKTNHNGKTAATKGSTIGATTTTTATSSSSSTLGIPLILKLGDNRQCHYHNLVFSSESEEQHHSVPVFTLAVPKSCRYALPIPHPAVLDTAKVYGHQWSVIMERRLEQYPIWNQTRQAVWRGSPTGGLMRQKLVYMANTIPASHHWEDTLPNNTAVDSGPDNATSDSCFNVAFGKPLHKINAKYNKGPKIRGRTRIWFEDFAQYRIVLDADGSSWSERFPCLLCLNTVVAKLDPFFVDYLWPTLDLGTHFVSIANDSSNLWSVVVPLLSDNEDADHQRACTISHAHQWCLSHMKYESMIHFFLNSLEKYVKWLDQGDPNWLRKWHQLLLHNMPPKHHHWQPLPIQKPKAYFPLWREGGRESEVDSDMESNDDPPNP